MGVLVSDVPETAPRGGLRSCCCGCSLQAGCIVIGAFGLVNGISTLYVSLYALCHFGPHLGADEHSIITNAILVFYGTLHLMTGLSLIYGADKRRPSLLKFWLFTRYVEFVIIVVASVYMLILMISSGASAVPIITAITSFAVGIGILCYCIAIVHSFCREITVFDNMQPLKEEI